MVDCCVGKTVVLFEEVLGPSSCDPGEHVLSSLHYCIWLKISITKQCIDELVSEMERMYEDKSRADARIIQLDAEFNSLGLKISEVCSQLVSLSFISTTFFQLLCILLAYFNLFFYLGNLKVISRVVDYVQPDSIIVNAEQKKTSK
ncbi:unnamed protein product [Protopolystoma xenopodis]|uniref:Uncharacterized protein n=1 Tax=Protopolystoma xenopodis TaxID=117903 RepID=A0A3S4ZRE6_9PLAT|nr:unnamed protein product [Protopolystoma xenopodis]